MNRHHETEEQTGAQNHFDDERVIKRTLNFLENEGHLQLHTDITLARLTCMLVLREFEQEIAQVIAELEKIKSDLEKKMVAKSAPDGGSGD